MNKMQLGKQPLNKILPMLKPIAQAHGLRLYVAREFKMARLLFANQYINGL